MTLSKLVIGSLFAGVLVAGQAVGHAQRANAAAPTRGSLLATNTVPPAAAVPEYRIGAEDVLDVVVWKDQDLSSRGVQVRPDGRISLPVVNDLMAAGLTPMELRNAIIKGLEPQYKDQEVSVTVREVNSMHVSVVGKVKAPNRFTLRSPVTVVDAIAMSGGFAEFAESDKIYVLRADGTKQSFNYDEFVKKPSAKSNFLLKAGDQVIVP